MKASATTTERIEKRKEKVDLRGFMALFKERVGGSVHPTIRCEWPIHVLFFSASSWAKSWQQAKSAFLSVTLKVGQRRVRFSLAEGWHPSGTPTGLLWGSLDPWLRPIPSNKNNSNNKSLKWTSGRWQSWYGLHAAARLPTKPFQVSRR